MSTEFTQTETETEDETSSRDEFTGSESIDDDGAPSKKSSNKVIIVVALVAVVAVVGFYGMRIINAPSGQQPQSAPQLPPAEVAQDSQAPTLDDLVPAQDSAVQEEVVVDEDPLAGLVAPPAPVDPLAMDPSQQPSVEEYYPTDPMSQPVEDSVQEPAQYPQPEEGLPVSADEIVQAQPVVQDPGLVVPAQPATDPALQALMGSAPSDQQVDVSPQPEVQEVVPEVVPVYPAPQVEQATESSFDVANLASVVGQAVTDALKPLEERWNARFDSLERRLSRVESRPQATAPARSSTPAPGKSSTPRASISRVPQAPKRPANRIEVLDAPASAPTPRPVVRTVESFTAASAPAEVSCSLGAILEGRAWLKRGDGSFESYIVGDTLPDGKTITAITPEKGITAGGQPWSCK